MCSLCGHDLKSHFHLFFNCYNVMRLWEWLQGLFQDFRLSSLDLVFQFMRTLFSSLVIIIKVVTITNIL